MHQHRLAPTLPPVPSLTQLIDALKLKWSLLRLYLRLLLALLGRRLHDRVLVGLGARRGALVAHIPCDPLFRRHLVHLGLGLMILVRVLVVALVKARAPSEGDEQFVLFE